MSCGGGGGCDTPARGSPGTVCPTRPPSGAGALRSHVLEHSAPSSQPLRPSQWLSFFFLLDPSPKPEGHQLRRGWAEGLQENEAGAKAWVQHRSLPTRELLALTHLQRLASLQPQTEGTQAAVSPTLPGQCKPGSWGCPSQDCSPVPRRPLACWGTLCCRVGAAGAHLGGAVESPEHHLHLCTERQGEAQEALGAERGWSLWGAGHCGGLVIVGGRSLWGGPTLRGAVTVGGWSLLGGQSLLGGLSLWGVAVTARGGRSLLGGQ